jgi:hypothetical protein
MGSYLETWLPEEGKIGEKAKIRNFCFNLMDPRILRGKSGLCGYTEP